MNVAEINDSQPGIKLTLEHDKLISDQKYTCDSPSVA